MYQDRGSYWVSTAPQRSDLWLKLREHRLTASNFCSAAGPTPDGRGYKTPDRLRKELLEGTPFFCNEAMQHGIDMEPTAREWYENYAGVKVEECGLCIPKWNPLIGGSPDGLVGEEGCIEIKCPKTMYPALDNYTLAVENGAKLEAFYHKHIAKSHYDQMQGCMAIIGRKWCDYIVYATESGKVYTERVYFNHKYWNEDLYPRILKFLQLTPGLHPILPEASSSN